MPEQPPKPPMKPYIDDALLDAPEIPVRHRKPVAESVDMGNGMFVGIDSETGLPVEYNDSDTAGGEPIGFTNADFADFNAEFGNTEFSNGDGPVDMAADDLVLVNDREVRDVRRVQLHRLTAELAEAQGKPDKQAVLERFRGVVVEGRDGREYTIGKSLGFGMFGAVLEATGPSGEAVAVKISTPFNRSEMYLATEPDSQADHNTNEVRATAIKALITEVAALQRLMKLGDENPAPKLHDAKFVPLPSNSDTRVAVVVMDKVAGQDLFTIEKQLRNGEVATDRAELLTQVFLDAAKDLQAIHKAGIIHSDIKPRNMMVDLSDLAKPTSQFIDFGSVLIPDLHKQQRNNDQFTAEPNTPQKPTYAVPNAQIGSEGFISQWESPSRPRDIYALGRSIQYMLFGGKDFKDLDAMNKARSTMTETEAQLSDLAQQMTQADKGLRPKISYVIAELEKLLSKHQAKKLQERITSSS